MERKEIVSGEPIFAPAKLTNHLGAALIDHLSQLVGREKRQRGERSLPAARACVAERHVEARIDLLVAAAVKYSRHDVLDGHLVQKSAQRRSLFDSLLYTINRLRAGVWEALDDHPSRRLRTPRRTAEEICSEPAR